MLAVILILIYFLIVDVTKVVYNGTNVVTSSVSSSFSIKYINATSFIAYLELGFPTTTLSYYDLPNTWFPLQASRINAPLTTGINILINIINL